MDFLKYTSGLLIIGACAANFLPFGGSLKRDTIAAYGCAALGNFVTTLNNDRDSAKFNPNRHIEVNINSPRHVKEAFKKTIPSYYPRNNHIVFDIGIFRSPVSIIYNYLYYSIYSINNYIIFILIFQNGYVADILGDNLWKGTLLLFLEPEFTGLNPGGQIHFGNIPAIREKLLEFWHLISPLCDNVELETAEENPLHVARELMNQELEDCGDNITNFTQVNEIILKHAQYPYIVLTKKNNNQAMTPSSSLSSSALSSSSSPQEVNTSRYPPNPSRISFYETYGPKQDCSTRTATPHLRRGLKRISEVIDLTHIEDDEDCDENGGRIPKRVPAGRVDFYDA